MVAGGEAYIFGAGVFYGYGPIGAVWFDGLWDHDSDSVPFDWQLSGQYEMIHRLQPSCLIGNNHHQTPFPGEDIQIFGRGAIRPFP